MSGKNNNGTEQQAEQAGPPAAQSGAVATPAPAPANGATGGVPAGTAGQASGGAGRPAKGRGARVVAAKAQKPTLDVPRGQKTASSGRGKATGAAKPAKAAPAGAAPAAPAKAAAPAPEFRALRTVEELVECYNEMVQTALDVGLRKTGTVKNFADVKTGRLACERLHAQILKARDVGVSEMRKQTKQTKKAKSKKAASMASRTKLDENLKIRALVKENPCREGTGRYKRVQNLLNHAGKRVGDFLKSRVAGQPAKKGTLMVSIREKWVAVG